MLPQIFPSSLMGPVQHWHTRDQSLKQPCKRSQYPKNWCKVMKQDLIAIEDRKFKNSLYFYVFFYIWKYDPLAILDEFSEKRAPGDDSLSKGVGKIYWNILGGGGARTFFGELFSRENRGSLKHFTGRKWWSRVFFQWNMLILNRNLCFFEVSEMGGLVCFCVQISSPAPGKYLICRIKIL